MNLRPIDSLIVVPLALLSLLALARLARLRPTLRPLVGPFAACAVVAVATVFTGPPSEGSWLALLFLLWRPAVAQRDAPRGLRWAF